MKQMNYTIVGMVLIVLLLGISTATAIDTVTRTLPATASPNDVIMVSLAIDFDDQVAVDRLVITETIPDGWAIVDASNNGNLAAAGKITWVISETAGGTIPPDGAVFTYNVTVPADASGEYTFSGIYGTNMAGTNLDILGDVNTSIDGTYNPPTLVTYTITNRTITPPQTTSIDVAFSEYVSAIIEMEDAGGNLVNQLYSSSNVKNPTEKIWNGTYTNGTTVPDGTYTVNVTGVNTTTGLSVINTSETITVSTGADTTAPTVDANTPIGTDVSASTAISVTFSEAMNTTSAEDAFSITPAVAGLFSWAGDAMTFTPDADLVYDTTYNVTIGTGAEDLAGNNLAEEFSWNFTTGSATATDTVTRTSPATASPNDIIMVSLAIDFDDQVAVDRLVITETVPDGWAIVDASNNGNLAAAGKITWVISETAGGTIPPDGAVFTYNVTVPADASGEYTFSGIYGTNTAGTNLDILGDVNITITTGDTYDVTISQPDNQTTPEGVNATYVLTVTNTGINTTDTYTLSCENINSASTVALDKATMTLAAGASDDVTLNVANTAAGTFNVTVSATSQTDADANCTTGYIMTTVLTVLETTEVNVTGETNFTAISGDANVTGNFNNTLTGWVNVTDVGDDLTASPDVNKSTLRAGLGSSRDVFVSGVYIDASQSNIESELAARNGTIRIELRYTDAEIAALGITNENTLDIYKFNTTTYMWELVRTQTYCIDSGRDTGANYTWVEVTHLCTLALVGTKPAPSGNGGGGGGGGDGTYPPGWGEEAPAPAATPAPTAAPEPTVAPAKAPTEAPTKAPTKAPTVAATEIETTELKTEGTPGFGAVLTVFAIAGLLVAAYLVMRRRE